MTTELSDILIALVLIDFYEYLTILINIYLNH